MNANEINERILSSKAQSMIENRKCFSGKSAEIGLDGAEYANLCPIFGTDVFGALMLFSDNPIAMGDGRMLQLSGKILGNLMQRF